jgi:hypothetical protein
MERKADYPGTTQYPQSSGERKRITASSSSAVVLNKEQGILPPPPGQHTLTPEISEMPHPSPPQSAAVVLISLPDFPRMYHNFDSGSIDILDFVPDYHEEEKN